MSKCELCKAAARIYCDSDRALLCWNCDARVHSANFLVARHFRNLLCHLCQSPTSWNASGSSLSPGMSICIRCDHRTKGRRVRLENENLDIESGNECMEEVIDENGDEDQLIPTTTDDDEDDDGENQVAPCSDVPPPPTVESLSSSSRGSSRRFWNCDPADSLKRMRGRNPDLKSHDDDDDDGSGMSELSSRALKLQRVDTYAKDEEDSGSKSATMMESVIEEQNVLKVADEEEEEEETAVSGSIRRVEFPSVERDGELIHLISYDFFYPQNPEIYFDFDISRVLFFKML